MVVTDEMLEPTQMRLRVLMTNHFLSVQPYMQRRLITTLAGMVEGAGRGEIEAVLHSMADDARGAMEQGYINYAACLQTVHSALRAVYDSLADPVESTRRPARIVGEIYLDFAGGEVSGSIEGCNAAEVADALMTIVEELRRMDETPAYIDYDEGKISVGNPTSNEEN
jgi:hypothetical protein